MAKRVIGRVNYRGSNTYWGGIQADKITVENVKSYWLAGVNREEFEQDPYVIVRISGKQGKLSTVELTLPASVAVALGGLLLSIGAGAAQEAEASF